MKNLVALTLLVVVAVAPVFAQPDEKWVAHYNGSADSYDQAEALALDSQGNIYVTGRSSYTGEMYDLVTIKYAPDGSQVWLARFSGAAAKYDGAVDIFVDGDAYAYVTGYCDTDIFGGNWITIKYDPNGLEVWNRTYSSGSGSAVVVDSAGNVIVVGSAVGTFGNDFTTIKYSPSGTELWVASYNGPVNVDDWGEGVALDGANNIYVTGSGNCGGIGTYCDFATIKYDPDGTQQWLVNYNPSGLYADTANQVLLDGVGNVYVLGSSSLTEYDADLALVKYSPAGVEIWDARFDEGSTDLATAMVMDPGGNIIVTGSSMISSPSPGHYDYTTIKYDASGSELWMAHYDGPVTKWDWADGIAVDSQGNVFVGGHSQGVGDDYDYATVKYAPDGSELWVMRYDGPAEDEDNGRGGVAVYEDINVYVTGDSDCVGTGADYTTVKYVETSIFADGFESGNTSAWSVAVP